MDDKPQKSVSTLSKLVKSQKSQTCLENSAIVPIQTTDRSMFDEEFASMKKMFANEMRRIEQEMNRFSTELVHLTGESTALQSGATASEDNKEKSPSTWEMISKSPLVVKEGDENVLKLQFDVSQFQPDEVKVRIVNDVLLVKAVHKEKTDHSTVFNEFNREFQLPQGTDPDTVEPSIDKDGVLTVKMPLTLEENHS